MPIKAKKVAIRAGLILLAVVKGAAFLMLKIFGWLAAPLRFIWRHGFRKIAFWIYRRILRLRLSGRFIIPTQKAFSSIFGHRYVVHTMIAFIVLFVSAENLYARDIDLGNQSQESFIFQMVGDAEGISFMETRRLGDSFLNQTPGLSEGATSTDAAFAMLGTDAGMLAYDQGVLKTTPSTDGEAVAPAEIIGLEADEPNDETKTELVQGPTTYVVQSGDTIGGIAQRHGISINTILWANDMTARSIIRPGQELIILPTTGVLHTVKRGETLGYIANKYDSDVESILEYNDIAGPQYLQIGDELVIPGGKQIVAPAPAPAPSRLATVQSVFTPSAEAPAGITGEVGKLVWPTDQHLINQYFKWNHPGIDVNGNLTQHTYAVDDGTVIFSGWNNGGYGNMILIDHGNGMKTRYAHHSKLFVKTGDHVTKGQAIGNVGSTGRSTGPHLHFEIYVNGTRVNPLNYYD